MNKIANEVLQEQGVIEGNEELIADQSTLIGSVNTSSSSGSGLTGFSVES